MLVRAEIEVEFEVDQISDSQIEKLENYAKIIERGLHEFVPNARDALGCAVVRINDNGE